MKYLFLSVLALMLMAGCASKSGPDPKEIVAQQDVNKTQTIQVKQQAVLQTPKEGSKVVPPLPKREKDIDVDSAVDGILG